MTREVKLSLILAFAVVLGVGVLLSDHLSGSQRSRLESVGTPRTVIPASANVVVDEPQQLILVDPNGRPAPMPERRSQPVPVPGDPRPGSLVGTRITNADPASPDDSSESLLDQLRDRMQQGVGAAWPNIKNAGQLPLAAGLDSEALDGLNNNSQSTQTSTVPNEPRATDTSTRSYRIQEGDTLWSIAVRHLGDGKRHTEISRLNRDRIGRDGTLRVGASILLPATQQNAAPASDAQPRQATEPSPRRGESTRSATYTVKSGDTLAAIAARLLGSASRYGEIVRANPNTLADEDSLEVGAVLVIPPR